MGPSAPSDPESGAQSAADAEPLSIPIEISPSVSPMPRLAARKRFDERSHTIVSIQLQQPHAYTSATKVFQEFERETPRLRASKTVRWTETHGVARVLNQPDFVASFGSPTIISLSPTHIWVGTSLGSVVGFSYHQELAFVLKNSAKNGQSGQNSPVETSPVASLCVSSNDMYVAAGYSDGFIRVWEIVASTSKSAAPDVLSPSYTVTPTSLQDRFSKSASGHLYGVPVHKVSFVGDSHQHMVSADISGLVFFHYGFRKFFGKYFVSHKLLGQNDANHSDPTGKYTIHDCQILPLGTAPQITDAIGLLAVITANILVVVSVRSLNNVSSTFPITHFKISKSRSVSIDNQASIQACLAWYPCLRAKNGVQNAKLAYSWNNVLTVLEVHNSEIPKNMAQVLAEAKDKDRAVPTIQMSKNGRWLTPLSSDKILCLKWLNSEILTAVVQDATSTETTLHFLYYPQDGSGLVHVGTDGLDSQQLASVELQSSGKYTHVMSYQASLQILRHRLVSLVNFHSNSGKSVFSGKPLKWADTLMEYIAQKDFVHALTSAYSFYSSENIGKLILCGLPHEETERHSVVEPFLVDIMRESASELFEKDGDHQTTLRLFFHLVTMITSKRGGPIAPDLLEIIDKIHELADHQQFFRVLSEFIFAKTVRNLSPQVFKSLVEYCVEFQRGEQLTQMVCLLDPTTLNIDMTLRLCETHRLRECSAYIWNSLLKDYTTPFLRFIGDLDGKFPDEDKRLVYTYMSYILSGRKFPTDDFLDASEEQSGREAICKILFSPDSELAGIPETALFPYLFKLLKYNAFEMLVTMNEFFENPYLNTDAKGQLNRQYIMDALLDIFHMNRDSFEHEDFVQLAIFAARNYPKYFQFIRLSESVLQETVELLCSTNKNHEDCELALECLLPVYDVRNEDYLIEQIRSAKFYNVVFNLYKSNQRFSKALEVWLEQRANSNLSDNFSSFADIVATTFTSNKIAPAERVRFLKIIEQNFDALASKYTVDMVALADTYNSGLHTMILDCGDELAYKYLQILFGEYDSNVGPGKIFLLLRYIETLCKLHPQSVAGVVQQYSQFLLEYEKESGELKNTMEKYKCHAGTAALLTEEGKYSEAVQKLLDGMEEAQNGGEIATLERLISDAIVVCSKDSGCWQSLVTKLVEMNKDPGAATESLNNGIYRCFRKLMDDESRSFEAHKSTEVLNSVMESAQLSNVRRVLQDIFTSYYFESEMHKITLSKVNTTIHKYMMEERAEKLRGWLVMERNCTSCGKVMWGSDVPPKHAVAWEMKKSPKMLLGDFDSADYEDCELTLFKCSHGYHSVCLRRLGSADCVICTNSS